MDENNKKKVSLVSIDGVDPRITENLANDLNELFGMKVTQERCWQGLHTLMKITKIADEHLRDPKFLFLNMQYEMEDYLDQYGRMVVTVLNCMLTQGRAVIVLTRDDLREVCQEDRNWKGKLGFGNDKYNAFLKMLYSNPAIECLFDGSNSGKASVIKFKPDAAVKLLNLSQEEVDRQVKESLEFVERDTKEKVRNQTQDDIGDQNRDLVGSGKYLEESSTKGGGSVHEIPTTNLQDLFSPPHLDKVSFDNVNTGPGNIDDPDTIWLKALAMIKDKLLLRSGFTVAYLEAFRSLLQKVDLPLVDREQFIKYLDLDLVERFPMDARNEKFRFGRECYQEVKANMLETFETWVAEKNQTHEQHQYKPLDRSLLRPDFMVETKYDEEIDKLLGIPKEWRE